jgi:hypothetical protein
VDLVAHIHEGIAIVTVIVTVVVKATVLSRITIKYGYSMAQCWALFENEIAVSNSLVIREPERWQNASINYLEFSTWEITSATAPENELANGMDEQALKP